MERILLAGPIEARNITADSLCLLCSKLFNHPQDNHYVEKDSYIGYDKRPVADILHSANNGCLICMKLQMSIRASTSPSTRLMERGVSCSLEWNKKDQCFRRIGFTYPLGHLDLYSEDGMTSKLIFYSSSLNVIEVSFQALGSGNDLSNTSLRTCQELVQAWLKNCTENHGDCNRGGPETSWLPTKLIDIGNTQQCIPRLVTSNSIRADTGNIRYISLTHRWDSKPLLKLTSQNLQSLEREIPMQSLSAVFRELLQFAKSLGVRFLWVDSLCILQDSKADWQRESLLMSKVYEYAYCNVAAAAAADGYNSLFIERDALQQSPFRITFKWKNYEKAYYCLYSNLWHIGVTTSPLNRRGWVLQERLLSPRTLSFNTQLFWECRSLKACEGFPEGLGPNADLESEDVDEDGELCPKAWRRIASETSTRYSPWARIIEQYMVSCLTVASDKLIAVSGIAQAMRSVVDDNYVAGLWERNLSFDLLWFVAPRWNGDGTYSLRAPTYQGKGLYSFRKPSD